MTRTERAVHAGPATRGLTVMVEKVRSQNRWKSPEYEYVAAWCRGYFVALGWKMLLLTTPETNA